MRSMNTKSTNGTGWLSFPTSSSSLPLFTRISRRRRSLLCTSEGSPLKASFPWSRSSCSCSLGELTKQ